MCTLLDASQAAGPSQPDWVKGLVAPMPAPTGAPGTWFPWENQFSRVRSTFTHGGISAAEGQAWDAQLRAIVDVIKTTPVVAGAAGFFPEAVGHIGVLDAGSFVDHPKQAPLVGGVTLAAWPPRDVQVDTQGRPRLVKGAHIRHFRLELNYVYPPRGDTWMTDAQGEFGPLVKQGEFAGFPLYANSLVVTKDRRLPFASVSQQRALEAFIADSDKAAARFQAGQVPGALARALAEARSRLAGFSDADRQAPAWLLPSRGRNVLEVVPANTPGASPLVSFDASFFDPKQPRHTLRVALVRELHNIVDGAQRGTVSDQISLQLLQQVDWRGFADRFLR